MSTFDHLLNLLESQAPTLAKLGREAEVVVNKIAAKEYFKILFDLPAISDSVNALIDASNKEFGTTLPVIEVLAESGGKKLGFDWAPGKILYATILRRHLRSHLKTEGWKLVGKEPTPLTDDEVDSLFYKSKFMNDDTVIEAATKVGAITSSGIFDAINRLIQWIMANSSEILDLLKAILGILVLFA